MTESSKAARTTARTGRIASRVTTLELLFDLVFVFTVSQVAEAIVEHPTVVVAVQSAITVGVVWWMYAAYSWLTNQAAEQTVVSRLLLIAAMATFLVMSLAIADVWSDAGVLFGVCYAVVVVIHAGMFIARGGVSGMRAMLRVGPLNLVAAASLVVSGFVDEPLKWLFLLLPYACFATSAAIARRVGLPLGPEHFVERHGLVMIIVFGESIVSVGAGLVGHQLGPAVVTGAIATVAVVAALWWCYFSGDDDRAISVMADASPQRRVALGMSAFYADHLVMIVGLIFLAAGLHGALVDAFAIAPPPFVWFIAVGVALFLAGEAMFRLELGFGVIAWRLLGALLVLASGFVGLAAAPIVQLAVVVAVIVIMLVMEAAIAGRRDGIRP